MTKANWLTCLGVASAFVFAATVSQAQTTNVCTGHIAQVLSEHGVKMGELTNQSWNTIRFTERGGYGPVDGYQFSAQPASCKDGSLNISVTTGCEISDIHTDGDCKIKGIPHWWW